jgi:cytochrome c2
MSRLLRLVLPVIALALAGSALVLLTTLGGEQGEGLAAEVGDARAGEAIIQREGCTSCHLIPGIVAPRGRVGPPLVDFSEERDIAGVLPNRPDLLVLWLRDPQAVQPGTLMPSLGLSEREARDVAAYLYSDP